MKVTRAADAGRRAWLVVVLACVWAASGCGERIGYSIYDRCASVAQCGRGLSCVFVRSLGGDAGDRVAGVCTAPCTTSSAASSVHTLAGAEADVCVTIDAAGNVDTTSFDEPGWYLAACGNDHFNAGQTLTWTVCSPFDYGGYPIDLWIPTP